MSSLADSLFSLKKKTKVTIILNFLHIMGGGGVVYRALGFHAVTPGSNPVLTSDQDLFPVALGSTLPHFVNSQLVASCQFGFLVMFLLSLNNNNYCFFKIIKRRVPVT